MIYKDEHYKVKHDRLIQQVLSEILPGLSKRRHDKGKNHKDE